MSYRIGDQIVLTRQIKLDEFAEQEDYTPEEFMDDRDLAFVESLNDDGSVFEFSYATYWTEDEDGNHVDLDEPIPDGLIHRYDATQEDPEEGWTWVTLEMLKDLKKPTVGLDSVCKKVVQLYRKHNNQHGSAFQFKGV